MAVNVSIRIDETLKSQLQELLNALGMDMTTFFVIAAKQAVRDQAMPFLPNLNTNINTRVMQPDNQINMRICQDIRSERKTVMPTAIEPVIDNKVVEAEWKSTFCDK